MIKFNNMNTLKTYNMKNVIITSWLLHSIVFLLTFLLFQNNIFPLEDQGLMLICYLSLGPIMKQFNYANGYRLETLPFFLP